MLRRITPAIPTLLSLVTHFERSVNRYQRYRAHTSPESEQDIQSLADFYVRECIYGETTPLRNGLTAKSTRELIEDLKLRDNAREGARLLLTGKTLASWTANRTFTRSTEDNYDVMREVSYNSSTDRNRADSSAQDWEERRQAASEEAARQAAKRQEAAAKALEEKRRRAARKAAARGAQAPPA
jgi:hypothetical protein